MGDLPTREEAQRIVRRLAEGPTTAVQESDIEDVAMSARCLVAVAEGRLVDRETIDYEAATQAYLDDDMHGDLDLIALCARKVVDAALGGDA